MKKKTILLGLIALTSLCVLSSCNGKKEKEESSESKVVSSESVSDTQSENTTSSKEAESTTSSKEAESTTSSKETESTASSKETESTASSSETSSCNLVIYDGNIELYNDSVDENTNLSDIELKKDGFILNGIYSDSALDNKISDDYKITQDAILYANFIQDLEYVISEVEVDGTKQLQCAVTGIGNYDGKDIIIPLKYNDVPVTKVGEKAFQYKDITSVTIGDNVTLIDNDGFSDSSINEIKFGKNLVTLGNGALANCYYLNEVILPESLNYIGEYAFYSCNMLTKLTLNKNIKSIGSNAFYYCIKLIEVTNLSDISVLVGGDDDYCLGKYVKNIRTNQNDDSIITEVGDYSYAYFNNKYHLLSYKGNDLDLVLPNNVNGCDYDIYNNAFMYTNITSVVISDCVENIGDCAFYKSNITSVTFGEKVTNIGEYAFYNCKDLISIVIPKSVVTIGTGAFYNCNDLIEVTNLSQIDIQAGVDDSYCLGNNAKVVRTSLEEESIIYKSGDFAFFKIDNIYYLFKYFGNDKNVVLPDNINNESYNIDDGALAYLKIESLYISSGVNEIGESAFAYCNNLMQVTVGENVTNIKDDAFTDDSRLFLINNLSNLELTIGSTDYGNIAYNAQVIYKNKTSSNCEFFDEGDYSCISIDGAYYIYKYNGTEKNIILPDSISGSKYGIANSTFSYSNIDSITIPDNVTSIGAYAFSDCSVKNIVLGNGIDIIAKNAFGYCTNLTSITIPNSVKTIKSDAFTRCENLMQVTLGENVTTIENYAFNNCESIREIYNLSSLKIDIGSKDNGQIALNAAVIHTSLDEKSCLFEYNDYSIIIIDDVYYINKYNGTENNLVLPDNINGNAYNIYNYAFKDSNIESIIIPDCVKIIGKEAFLSCGNLTSVSLGNGIETISNNAFYFSKLSEIVFPNSLKTIGENAFLCCNFTSVTIPNSVTSIGYYAFGECKSLESFTFGTGLDVLPSSILKGCSKLETIVIPDNVTTINDSAFYWCTGLKNIVLGKNVIYIGESAFNVCDSLEKVYYNGTKDTKSSIEICINNDKLTSAKWYYIEPESNITSGDYFKYDEDNNIIEFVAFKCICVCGDTVLEEITLTSLDDFDEFDHEISAYEFEGFYSDKECTLDYNFEDLSADTVVYASYIVY
ncbi:MAG: leucine-rich repeat domain-containing protein [Acholeplasmatales bacterium]|nr:leucine-rich repeat domain-containing protein [Acholeplasmatales bacterium]